MLKHLELRNFKCFEKLNLDLKSVNVFTGLNGMGKSTVIQSLLVLYQSLNNNSNAAGLKFNADLISLGNSQDVFYDKAEENNIQINITNTEEKKFNYKTEYKQDVDFLPFVANNPDEKFISDSSFTFLSEYYFLLLCRKTHLENFLKK